MKLKIEPYLFFENLILLDIDQIHLNKAQSFIQVKLKFIYIMKTPNNLF